MTPVQFFGPTTGRSLRRSFRCSWRRCSTLVALAVCVPAGMATAAFGQACQEDVKNISVKRQAVIVSLNQLSKAGKGKLDPAAACPKLKSLAAIEGSFADYLTKNKDWCSIPEDVIANISASHAKTQKFAAQACNVAAQVVKMKKEAESQAATSAAQQAARLPAGPL